MNSVELIGNLTKDPELRYTKENKPVCIFTVAINRPMQKGREQEADFINISVWNKQAENCKKYLTKGRKIAIEGSIRTGTYEIEDKKYKSFEIMANKVYFLSSNINSQEEQKTIENEQETKSNSLNEEVFEQFGNSFEITDDDIAF